MNRSVGYAAIATAILLTAVAYVIQRQQGLPVIDIAVELWLTKVLYGLAVLAGTYGVYNLIGRAIIDRTTSKRRQHDARNVLRLVFGVAATIGLLGILTEQWVGVLFSLGVIGFAVTFALQQPLFSLTGWFYIMIKHPYRVGDRVAIADAKGDVISIDFFATTLWEINGPLVSTHQPSGRIITVPNSVVLSSHVYNYAGDGFPYVWNETSFQVAYETDLALAKDIMTEEASEVIGDEMAKRIKQYRARLKKTPVELEVQDKPSVNAVQAESWVELKLRYLVHPKQGQRVRNELVQRVLARFNEHPDRVKFPLGRNR